MKLSVSLYSCNPLISEEKRDIYGVMDFFRENGVDCVELVDGYVTDGEIPKIKEYLDKNNMKVSSYSASNDFVIGTDEEREAQVEYLKKCCDTALYFGTNIVRVFAGNIVEGKSYEDCFECIVDSFKKCVKTAEEKGVYFCLENHGVLAGKPEQVKQIIDAVGSPNLKATADTGNFNLVGANPYEAVKLLGENVAHVHFKDMVETENGTWTALDGRRFLGCAIGDGVVKLDAIVKHLSECGYKGYFSIEYEAPENECLAGVKKSIEFTRSVLSKYFD